MALSNEEIVQRVKDKLEAKNRKIQEKDEEIVQLKKKVEQLEAQMADSLKKIESREKLLDSIGDILAADET